MTVPIDQERLDLLEQSGLLTPEGMEANPDTLVKVASDRLIEIAWSRSSPPQKQFTEKFFERKHRVYAALGANRSGKSVVAGWFCFGLFLRELAQAGDYFWCVGLTLDRSISGQQQELWKCLPREMFGEQIWDEKIGFGQHRRITLLCKGGGKCVVEFRSADQDASTFEQAKLRGVWVDERCPEVIYDRIIPRTIDLNGFILYSDIPEQEWQRVRLVNAAPEARVYVQRFKMRDNAHNLPPNAIADATALMLEEEVAMRVEGEFFNYSKMAVFNIAGVRWLQDEAKKNPPVIASGSFAEKKEAA